METTAKRALANGNRGGGRAALLLAVAATLVSLIGPSDVGAETSPEVSAASDGCPPNDPPVLRTDVPTHCESYYDAAGAEFDRFVESFGGMGALIPRLARRSASATAGGGAR